MNNLKDLTRIMHENYNKEELIEYYQRKVILLKEINANEQIINNYLQKIKQLDNNQNESSKQK